MNLTSLNKIVSLLVSGALAVLVVVLCCVSLGLNFKKPPNWWTEIAEPMLQSEFMASVVLGSLTVFCGMLTQSCGELVMKAIRPQEWKDETDETGRKFKREWRCKFFWISKEMKDAKSHHGAALSIMNDFRSHPLSGPLAADPNASHSAVLFHNGSETSVRWGTEHYTMALLAANFIVVTFLATLALGFRAACGHWTCLQLALLLVLPPAILWLLVRTIAYKKLFAYEVAAREAALVLWDELQAEKQARAQAPYKVT